MGIGNLTELTYADTAGINATLLGICSELDIRQVLAMQVSKHARRAIREAALARRILYAARELSAPPKHIDDGLMALHERAPFPYVGAEIEELAARIHDPSYRIQVSREGSHVYNRDGHWLANDPFALYPSLSVEQDGGHGSYLGVELGRAQIAWQLGKRYTPDEELGWGCAVDPKSASTDMHTYKPAGGTTRRRRQEFG